MNAIAKNQNCCSPSNRYLFDDFFTRELDRFLKPVTKQGEATLTASANVWEDEQNLNIELAMPGIKKEDVKVNVENGLLTVSTQNEGASEQKEKDFLRREFHYGAYTRNFRVSEKRYKVNEVSAKLEDGILHLVLPKLVEEKKENVFSIEVK